MKLAFLSIVTAINLPSTIALGEDLRPSPYFIDGIHCQGMESLTDPEDIGRLYRDETIAAMHVKSARQQQCEHVFSAYGIEKFTWVTPEDLEKLSFAIKRGQQFKTAEIKIEKSDTKNHVHLVGVFTLHPPEVAGKFHMNGAIEKGEKGASDRKTMKMDAYLGILKRGPSNPPDWEFTVSHWQTNADPLTAENLRYDDDELFDLSPEESTMLTRPDGRFDSIGFQMNTIGKYPGKYNVYVDFDYSRSKLTGDEDFGNDITYELGISQKLNFWGDHDSATLGAMHAVYYHLPTDVIVKEGGEKAGEKTITFATYKTILQSRSIDLGLDFYRSFTKELHSFYTVNFLWRFAEYGGIQHGFAFDAEAVRNAILARHRFGLPDADLTHIYYQARTQFVTGAIDNDIHLNLGVATYNSRRDSDRPYDNGMFFGELGWNAHTGGHEIGLAFLYGNGRTY